MESLEESEQQALDMEEQMMSDLQDQMGNTKSISIYDGYCGPYSVLVGSYNETRMRMHGGGGGGGGSGSNNSGRRRRTTGALLKLFFPRDLLLLHRETRQRLRP